MNCKKCGRTDIPLTAKWCGKCGTKIPARILVRSQLPWLRSTIVVGSLIAAICVGLSRWKALNQQPEGLCGQARDLVVEKVNKFQDGAYIATGLENIHESSESSGIHHVCVGEITGHPGDSPPDGTREGLDVTIRRAYFQSIGNIPIPVKYAIQDEPDGKSVLIFDGTMEDPRKAH